MRPARITAPFKFDGKRVRLPLLGWVRLRGKLRQKAYQQARLISCGRTPASYLSFAKRSRRSRSHRWCSAVPHCPTKML